MPYTGMGGDRYQCEGCGNVYQITSHHVPMRDKDSEHCPRCGALIVSWNGSRIYSVRLVQEGPGGPPTAAPDDPVTPV